MRQYSVLKEVCVGGGNQKGIEKGVCWWWKWHLREQKCIEKCACVGGDRGIEYFQKGPI